jgi:putative hemolysin
MALVKTGSAPAPHPTEEIAAPARDRRLVELSAGIASPVARSFFRLVEPSVERLLSLSTLNRFYSALSPEPGDRTFFATVLRELRVGYTLPPEDIAKVPAVGPLVVVANHPFGGLDGLVMGDILTRLRPDFRLLANHWLYGIDELKPWVLPVDAFGGPSARARNLTGIRRALDWLGHGGALGIFPAGTVSHLQWRKGCVADPDWHTTVARLVRRTGATVVTMFFDGRNSLVFQLSGLIHPTLRTVLLPSELLKRAQSRIPVRIGRPIPTYKIARYPDDRTLTSYLRFKTYMLKWRDSPIRPRFSPRTSATPPLPVEAPRSADLLAAEVARLPAGSCLAEQGTLQVFVAAAPAIPTLLGEIGQLRERTFRAVGEGTGRTCDLDRFDGHYQHLFLWNQGTRQVVGSYRIGQVDRILSSHGERGLYTSTLFKLKPGLVDRLGPALELGRSFVRAECQGQPGPLALLWRGIGELLVRNPTYKVLFGPVSISKDYAVLSRRLMVEMLGTRFRHRELAALVEARNPPRYRLTREERDTLAQVVRDADDVSTLVSDIEADDKGLPMLLRQYLRLNAFLLSFNLDPSFGNCIDGLIVADLRTAEPKLLRRYLGDVGYASYMAVPGATPVLSLRTRS